MESYQSRKLWYSENICPMADVIMYYFLSLLVKTFSYSCSDCTGFHKLKLGVVVRKML